MSRKRQLKKERARLEELDRQLERLARQGADEAVLELAQGRAGELGPASLEIWSQAADRALRRALAGADLARVKRLLAWICPGPTAGLAGILALAEAVVHLDEGRPAEARTALASAATEGASCPPGLAAALLDLCDPAGPDQASPVWSLRAALSSLQEGGDPERLRPPLAELRAALPGGAGGAAARRLLDAMDEALHLLDGLSAAEREPGRTRALFRPLLAVFRTGPPAPLLSSLHHALHLRWRSLLEHVAEREGPAAWIDLHEAAPAVFALDLEISGAPDSLRRWSAVHGLRRHGRYRQLAGLLASLGGTETAPERRVLLWSLELWAWEQVEKTRMVKMGGPEDAFELFLPVETPDLEALRRLGRMAEDAATLLPSEQRPGAARFLRARLIDLTYEQLLSSHAAEAAEALLRHLPDDPCLLFIALAGARDSGDLGRQQRIAARIAERGTAGRADRETLLRLVSHLTLGTTELIAGLLPLLRPLFDEEAWPQALDTVLQDFTEYVRASLEWSQDEDAEEAESLLRELEIYRASLAERPGFAALEQLLKKAAKGRGEGPRRKPRRRRPDSQGKLIFDV